MAFAAAFWTGTALPAACHCCALNILRFGIWHFEMANSMACGLRNAAACGPMSWLQQTATLNAQCRDLAEMQRLVLWAGTVTLWIVSV